MSVRESINLIREVTCCLKHLKFAGVRINNYSSERTNDYFHQLKQQDVFFEKFTHPSLSAWPGVTLTISIMSIEKSSNCETTITLQSVPVLGWASWVVL